MKKTSYDMTHYGFSPAEAVALFALELSVDWLHPCWEGCQWAEGKLDWLLNRANALLLTDKL